MGQKAKKTYTPFSSKGRMGLHKMGLQMVNPSGLLLKVAPRITNSRINMIRLIRLVLVLLCITVVEIIMEILDPSNPQNPMIIRWTKRTQPQILMVTGGKVRFTTKQSWCLSLGGHGVEWGGVGAGLLHSCLVGRISYLNQSRITSSISGGSIWIITSGQM